MSRTLSPRQAIVLGLAVLLGIGLATGGLFAIGKRQWLWSDTFHVRAAFKEISGVEPGTRVRVQGVEAGEVESVQAPNAPGGNVRMPSLPAPSLHSMAMIPPETKSPPPRPLGPRGLKTGSLTPGSRRERRGPSAQRSVWMPR